MPSERLPHSLRCSVWVIVLIFWIPLGSKHSGLWRPLSTPTFDTLTPSEPFLAQAVNSTSPDRGFNQNQTQLLEDWTKSMVLQLASTWSLSCFHMFSYMLFRFGHESMNQQLLSSLLICIAEHVSVTGVDVFHGSKKTYVPTKLFLNPHAPSFSIFLITICFTSSFSQ